MAGHAGADARSELAKHRPAGNALDGRYFAVATIPAWFLLQERGVAPRQVASMHWVSVLTELGQHFSEFRRLLFCIVCYQAGISIVITLAAVYAEQVMGFSLSQTIVLIVVVNITAAAGAWSFGHLQDRLGHRRALGLALTGWLITSLTAFAAVRPAVFWFAACLAGLCMGTTQSAGRAMVGAFAPADRLSRFLAYGVSRRSWLQRSGL